MASRKGPTSKDKGNYPPRGLPPKEPQRIALYHAVELTQRYRKSAPASEHGGFFWADGLRELLDQAGCVGLRYYHGLDAGGRYQIVLVGVDGNGRDIVTAVNDSPTSGKGGKTMRALSASSGQALLLDMHWPCPPWCDPNSPLL